MLAVGAHLGERRDALNSNIEKNVINALTSTRDTYNTILSLCGQSTESLVGQDLNFSAAELNQILSHTAKSRETKSILTALKYVFYTVKSYI